MIASEFAQRLGVPVSKIRYYDRLGLGQTERCEENNYRNFEPSDALEYGNALLLRSFDMNLKEIARAQSGQNVDEIGIWLEDHVRELEEHLRLEQIRLARLKEMQRYWRTLGSGTGKAAVLEQDANYEIWSFDMSRALEKEEIAAAAKLMEHLPYSYIAAKVPQEELEHSDIFHPILGIGILERSRVACGLEIPACATRYPKGIIVSLIIEKENFETLTRKDIQPILDVIEEKHLVPRGDLIGRFVFSHTRNQKRVHGLWAGIQCLPPDETYG